MSKSDKIPEPSEIAQFSIVQFAARLFPKLVVICFLAVLSILLWPLYGIGKLIWYRPPNVVHFSQIVRYLQHTWRVCPPAPGISFLARCWITLSIIQKLLFSPILGIAWLVDEFFYGRALNAISIDSPLFVISAGRSGSTQITRYLEDDPNLVAPNILQCMFPYLWLWRLASYTIGRLISQEKVREKIHSMAPPELLERHEADPFKTDTFDGAFYTFHLNHMAFSLGPDLIVEDFGFARFAPYDRWLWEEDFIDLVDRIGRKTMLYAGYSSFNSERRFLLKGHFLCAADALEKKYPNAVFLTVIRDPLSRIRSAINYMRVNPADPVLGPVPWDWLASGLEKTEIEYCEVEKQWFTRASGARRCVVRFSEFVVDLETAMKKVYLACCGENELPPHVPKKHAPRERKNYSVDRSLTELGVDEEMLQSRLADYIAWCQKCQ